MYIETLESVRTATLQALGKASHSSFDLKGNVGRRVEMCPPRQRTPQPSVPPWRHRTVHQKRILHRYIETLEGSHSSTMC